MDPRPVASLRYSGRSAPAPSDRPFLGHVTATGSPLTDQHSQCHVMRLSSSPCAQNPPAWTAATRTPDPIPSVRAARSTRRRMQRRAATVWGSFSPGREPPTASRKGKGPGAPVRGSGRRPREAGPSQTFQPEGSVPILLEVPSIAPEDPGVQRARALGVHTLYSCPACGLLQSHILYTLNTSKEGFKRVIFALEGKRRNLLSKAASEMDALTHTETFPWLMGFNNPDVSIIFDK